MVYLFLVRGGVTCDCYQPTLTEKVYQISHKFWRRVDSVSRFDTSRDPWKNSELNLSKRRFCQHERHPKIGITNFWRHFAS